MENFMTINKTAREYGITTTYLRRKLAEGKLYGFWSSSRFYVNVPKLLQELENSTSGIRPKN